MVATPDHQYVRFLAGLLNGRGDVFIVVGNLSKLALVHPIAAA